MGSIMKWNLFAPPKSGFLHVLPIFLQDSSCGALVIEPLARSPSLNLLQKLEKRLGHGSVPWSSFAGGESRHGSEASNHAVGQAETPFLFLGPLRTFKWELFERYVGILKIQVIKWAMASWLWGKLDRYTKFIRSHQIQVCSLQIWNSMEQAFLPSETLLFNTSLNL